MSNVKYIIEVPHAITPSVITALQENAMILQQAQEAGIAPLADTEAAWELARDLDAQFVASSTGQPVRKVSAEEYAAAMESAIPIKTVIFDKVGAQEYAAAMESAMPTETP
jgi:hypothetical protein